jgi:hypothetical protein
MRLYSTLMVWPGVLYLIEQATKSAVYYQLRVIAYIEDFYHSYLLRRKPSIYCDFFEGTLSVARITCLNTNGNEFLLMETSYEIGEYDQKAANS